jgi:hypothetical protein
MVYIFSYQKFFLGYILEGLGMESVGIFYDHSEYVFYGHLEYSWQFGIFTAILYILCPLGNFGTFPPFWYIYGNFVYFMSIG